MTDSPFYRLVTHFFTRLPWAPTPPAWGLASVGCGVVDCIARRNRMRPTDKTHNQDLPRGQSDHAALYVSLELSRSTWLVTSLSPNSDKMSKHTIAAGDAPNYLSCWHACVGEPSSSSEDRLMSWSSKKPASTGSGYIDCSSQMTLKAMSSILRRSPCRGGGGARRRTGSMAKRCCGHCWPGSGESRVSAKWLYPLHRSKRTTGVFHVNAPTCCESEFSTSIASKGCSLAKESPVMILCTRIGEPGSMG